MNKLSKIVNKIVVFFEDDYFAISRELDEELKLAKTPAEKTGLHQKRQKEFNNFFMRATIKEGEFHRHSIHYDPYYTLL